MIGRRRFLGACIATLTAPAIVRAESLMPVRAPRIRLEIGRIESFQFITSPATSPALENYEEGWLPKVGRYVVLGEAMWVNGVRVK